MASHWARSVVGQCWRPVWRHSVLWRHMMCHRRPIGQEYWHGGHVNTKASFYISLWTGSVLDWSPFTILNITYLKQWPWPLTYNLACRDILKANPHQSVPKRYHILCLLVKQFSQDSGDQRWGPYLQRCQWGFNMGKLKLSQISYPVVQCENWINYLYFNFRGPR